jgi:hypothetical protein
VLSDFVFRFISGFGFQRISGFGYPILLAGASGFLETRLLLGGSHPLPPRNYPKLQVSGSFVLQVLGSLGVWVPYPSCELVWLSRDGPSASWVSPAPTREASAPGGVSRRVAPGICSDFST